jgi:hypothetical protein
MVTLIAALNHHQHTLSQIVETGLNERQRAKLDELLQKEPGHETDQGWRYRLTLLKKPFQSTQPSKIKANLADLTTLQSLYLDLTPLVQRLDLSYESIRYYAYCVIKAQISKISRRADEDRFLHLIAFIVYQTFKLNDTLNQSDPPIRPKPASDDSCQRHFRVGTPKQEEVEALSLGTFLPERKYISMLEMLATVDQATNFLDEFEHWQFRNQRVRPSKKTLFAGIIGFGCDIGHRKLAQISKQIDEADLRSHAGTTSISHANWAPKTTRSAERS